MEGASPAAGLLEEVRGFLSDLHRDWPDLFRAKSRPASPPAPPRPAEPVFVPAPPPDSPAAHFQARASYWAPLLGVTFGRVRVKDQRSLWGSCSPNGDLNFNWRLTMAPPEILDYVVIHELAHRLEMNHSGHFWAHVARVCPEHKARRRWLRKNGRALQSAPRPR